MRKVLCEKIVQWKSGLEAKGLKMNTGKTKVMFSCSMKDRVQEKGKWPCGVFKKGVGNNSILCHGCCGDRVFATSCGVRMCGHKITQYIFI